MLGVNDIKGHEYIAYLKLLEKQVTKLVSNPAVYTQMLFLVFLSVF